MAFSDPQTITINAVANALPRVAPGKNSGTFQKDDGRIALGISHTVGKSRTRRSVRIDHSKVAPDPLIAAQNILFSMSAYLVVDVPVTGYTIAEQKQIVDALAAWLSASSGGNTTKLLGGEN